MNEHGSTTAQEVVAWLPALIVGGVRAIARWNSSGQSRTALKQIDLVPTKTLQAVKENVSWTKDRIT